MQEASGVDVTDYSKWFAQLPSADLDTDHRPHSSTGSVFNRSTRFGFLMDVTCSRRHRGCFRVAETGFFSASPKSRQALRARYSKAANVARHAAGTRVCACKEMMFDCSCVCHWGFQNEVIGG